MALARCVTHGFQSQIGTVLNISFASLNEMRIALATGKIFVTVSRKGRNDQSGKVAGRKAKPKNRPGRASEVGVGVLEKSKHTRA
jgi:hypothetical protein